MARYENEGFCPYNSFYNYLREKNGDVSTICKRTYEILGGRIADMVYTKNGGAYGEERYVVDCLAGSTSTLGLEVACKLESMIPNEKNGRKILITDINNPFQIPGLEYGYKDNKEAFIAPENLFFREDERYIVGITDEADEVHMYFFKKR